MRSILGRYLEHSRIFAFHNDGNPEYFLGSADWMSRNLRQRVEAIVKVEDPKCKAALEHLLRIYDEDNSGAWLMDGNGNYTRFPRGEGEPVRCAQDTLMQLHSSLVDGATK